MYSIGEFSKICDIPVKTIRYYSDIGLLKPSYIDPVTNYRYYDYDKIQIMKKIMLLKSCQFSLSTVKEFINSTEQVQLKSILAYKIDELEEKKEQISEQIEELKRLNMQIEKEISIIPGPFLSDCFIENREETLVYTIREKIKVQFIDELVKNLFNRVYAFNLVITGKLMAIFHEREFSQKEADIELLLPVEHMKKIEGFRTLSSGIYACITVKGPYSELDEGYKKLNSWIFEQNLTQIEKEIEIYEEGLVPVNFNSRDIKPDLNRHPSEFVTKICIPVIKK
ncbi:MerR family transcriptional regulator [Lysinibacillus sphaericus]|uniref:MerR family transcriptional regulator n=1 Tax=Lysinibacillus sphaericus TaxID=1421 RepID=UPI0021631A63|nr:MerR family transcriptional regulator [Lysinibacillus sphaericus]MCS1381249.1 MerR family transcriptional regulator [Lysinibacillus sphaericus]